MTCHEYANCLIRIGDKLKTLPEGPHPFNRNKPSITDEDYIIGAALLWMYLRDLWTATTKETFTRDEILVALDLINKDTELWPSAGLLKQIADSMETDDE